tara:strand:- start:339 stop:764 length:426 start_codon:yes stop_codon:yes gene_type:complete
MTGSQFSPYAKCTILATTPIAQDQTKKHLLIVVTDPVNIPPWKIVTVPINTFYESSDSTCILNQGDHPFIRHKSFINYKETRIIDIEKIRNGISKKVFSSHHDVDQEIFTQICNGFEQSNAMITLAKGIYRRSLREKISAA